MTQHLIPLRNPEDWRFFDSQNTAVFTTTHVLRLGEPILFVSHDNDGSWQFHYGGSKSVGDAMIVALEAIVQHDPSVSELSNLPLGWRASRIAPNTPWHRKSSDFDETNNNSSNET
jgi:hypothetical protein